ncbi:CHAT domain-containing protein [Archangium sp.]|uniref:nSTAND1 domain-containing NTPase n=1 Tax=Archangium sp. TaxID=1872627 RepID=UPI002D3A7C65|nr:CHAT domain-containing protein [Archangium sp.]HYO60055.1 CHAT domain-containing protein [Archangium sp.]
MEPRTVLPAEGGRILFAWSAAGGPVPADAHLGALTRACRLGDVSFEPSRDVLGHVSLQRLAEVLKAAREPISVLHILCHGGRTGDTYGLLWNAAREGGTPELVDGARLRQVLAPYAGTLRMVVLSACRSGGVGELGSHLGSVAQELHRVGIPAVVASRLPLSVMGSIRLTEVLYGELLGRPCSLERALGEARRQLALEGRCLDWASLQLYARAEEGPDLRPLAIRPYRGLLAFEAKHRRFFFGREKLAGELLERVREAVAGRKPRFLVVAGASGAGKSSVVMAGLVPLLPVEEWDVVVVRPCELAEGGAAEVGFASLRGLSRRLRAAGDSEPLAGGQGAIGTEVLEEVRKLRQARPGRRLLLVVDQLEEVFTQLTGPEECSELMRVLWTLGTSEEWECVVIGTLRVDHFERCAEVALDERTRLDRVVYSEGHRVFVAHMEAEEVAAAIERPARAVGLELEAGLVEQLCQDVGQEPGALPLLEYVLDLLWERREGRRLTNQVYKELGGVTGALTRTADRLYAELSETQQRQARRLLVKLVDFRDAASPQTRRRVRVEEVRPVEEEARKAFEEVLEKLVRSRLLVKGEEEQSEGEGGAWVQFAHEALIRRWKVVQEWVKEDWEREQQLRELDTWAKAWEAQQGRGDRGASYLLTGDRLGYARRVRDSHRGELSARSLRFIVESDAAEVLRKKRLVAVVSSLAVLLLVSVVAAVVAAWQRAQAIEQRGEAERQRTSALDSARIVHSRRLYEQDPSLAVLVLREVMHPEETPEWTQTAVDILQRPLSTAFLKGHQERIEAISFSPDGKRVVTASLDKTAWVWSADGKGEPVVLRGHEGSVYSAAFSPDGKRVVTASEDKAARIWTIGAASLQALLRTATTICLSREQRQRFLLETLEQAQSGHEQCERSHYRVPEPASSIQ